MEEEYEPEVWVDLKDDLLHNTEDKYSISSYGRVYNKEKGVFVSPVSAGLKEKNNNYWYVNLYIGGVVKLRRVHYLQAYSFFGEPPEDDAGSVKKQTCDYIDRNRFNNTLWNLRWLGRKRQMANRDCTVMVGDVPLSELLRKEYSDISGTDFTSCSQFFLKRLNHNTYEEVKELYLQRERLPKGSLYSTVKFKGKDVYLHTLCEAFGIPVARVQKLVSMGYSIDELFPEFKIKSKVFDNSLEVNSKWYPTKRSLCDDIGISDKAFYERLKNGVALTDMELYDHKDIHRVLIDGHFMNTSEHCKRLKVSEQRVRAYLNKHKLTLEEALVKAQTPQRIIKHSVSGTHSLYGDFNNEVKRNKAWWIFFGLEPKYANNKMYEGYTMSEVLKYKVVDIENLIITPYTM